MVRISIDPSRSEINILNKNKYKHYFDHSIYIMDAESQSETVPPPPSQQISLTDIPVTSENVALNVMVSFLNTAQRRGAFSFDESAKIWECIQLFIGNKEGLTQPSEPVTENITLETD